MKLSSFYLAFCFVSPTASAFSFSVPSRIKNSSTNPADQASKKSTSLFPKGRRAQTVLRTLAATTLSPPGDAPNSNAGLLRTPAAVTTTTFSPPEDASISNNGRFTFKSKYGYLNPFAIFYGATSILFAIPWFISLTLCQMVYKMTNNTWDQMRRVPVLLNQTWLVFVLTVCRCFPKIENPEILEEFYKEGRAAMFVANHNSWMDIPFVCMTIGWKTNHKVIAKAELSKVPILGKAIDLGGHVKVDRGNRRSQVTTLKAGMKWLKNGVHLCAFPEGTRSKDRRLLPFKNGGFKMASKVGSPIIPLSIVASGESMPSDWIFPRRRARGLCKVVVHEPIESNDKTEEELAQSVRAAIIEGLPENQRPLE